jgi:hypothetical protein
MTLDQFFYGLGVTVCVGAGLALVLAGLLRFVAGKVWSLQKAVRAHTDWRVVAQHYLDMKAKLKEAKCS